MLATKLHKSYKDNLKETLKKIKLDIIIWERFALEQAYLEDNVDNWH